MALKEFEVFDHDQLVNRHSAGQHQAWSVGFTPAGTLASTSVQDAIEELDTGLSSLSKSNSTGVASATISSGSFTVFPGSNSVLFYTIDTEGAAASDTLTSITGGVSGVLLFLQTANDARDVTCQHGANLCLGGGMDFQLDSTKDKLCLICVSSGTWHEVSRSSNV